MYSMTLIYSNVIYFFVVIHFLRFSETRDATLYGIRILVKAKLFENVFLQCPHEIEQLEARRSVSAKCAHMCRWNHVAQWDP